MNFFRKIFGNRENFEKPDFVEQYEQLFTAKKQKNDTEDIIYTVFDTETTGLDRKLARVLSIGLVQCNIRQVEVSSAVEFHLAHSDDLLTSKPENVEIHGITRNKTREGMEPEHAAEEFLHIIGNSVLVAHHADFDVYMVEKEIQQFFPPFKLLNKIIDTADLAKRIEQPMYSGFPLSHYDLDSLLKRYSIRPLERHTALGDAYSTAVLLMKLLALLRKRGVKKL